MPAVVCVWRFWRHVSENSNQNGGINHVLRYVTLGSVISISPLCSMICSGLDANFAKPLSNDSRFAHFFRSSQNFNALNSWDLYDYPILEES